MRKAMAALVVLGALVGASVASAHIIRTAYMHDKTAKTAKAVYNGLEDSTSFGVDRCRRFSNHKGKCIGVIRGASVDPANPATGPLAWECVFVERFVLSNFEGVRKAIGAVQCGGAGQDFIK